MKEFKASTTINASPEAIWDVLTNGGAYPEWDPNIIRIEGTIAPGETIKVFTKISDQTFPVTVSEFEPGKKMTWSSGMPLGLFKGARTFTIEPNSDGSVNFTSHEVFTGPLLVLIGRTIPDLSESFEQFVQGVKSRAESMS